MSMSPLFPNRRDVTGTLALGAAAAALPFGPGVFAAPAGRWMSAAQVPVATQEVYPCAHKGKLWLAGGIAGGVVPGISKRVDIYDPQTDSWTRGPDLPTVRHHVTLASTQGRLHAIGGYKGSLTGGLWRMRSTVWALNEAAGAWEKSTYLPAPQAEMTTGVMGRLIHIAGGRKLKGKANRNRRDHVDVGDHYAFDPKQNEWQERAPLSTPRNSAAGGIVGHYFYVVGGRNGSGNLAVNEVYDSEEDKWRAAKPMPKAQAGLAGAMLNGKLYVFGGEVFQPEPGVFREAWVYDPQADDWSALPHMPTPRHGLGAVALGGKIYVVSGAIKPGGSGRSKANEVFVPG